MFQKHNETLIVHYVKKKHVPLHRQTKKNHQQLCNIKKIKKRIQPWLIIAFV